MVDWLRLETLRRPWSGGANGKNKEIDAMYIHGCKVARFQTSRCAVAASDEADQSSADGKDDIATLPKGWAVFRHQGRCEGYRLCFMTQRTAAELRISWRLQLTALGGLQAWRYAV